MIIFACKYGNIKVVEYICKFGRFNVNTQYDYKSLVKLGDPSKDGFKLSNIFTAHGIAGETSLHLAAMHNQFDCVKVLLANGVDITVCNRYDQTPLHSAAACAYIRDYDQSPPHVVVADTVGKSCVKLLLENGADVNVIDRQGQTPLHSAADSQLFGHINIKILLENRADINVSDNNGHTPLHLAAIVGSSPVGHLNVLLIADIVNKIGQTPFHLAAEVGWVGCEHVKVLLEKGADIEAIDKKGQTPLHSAAADIEGSKRVKLLLENYADINVIDNNGQTPLHLAISARLLGFEDLKVLFNTSVRKNLQTPLPVPTSAATTIATVGAIEAGTIIEGFESVKILLENGADINVIDNNGQTPLHISAASRDGYSHIDILLRHGACVSLVDVNGNTPLQLARRQRNVNAIQLLEHLGNIPTNVTNDKLVPCTSSVNDQI